MAYEHKAGSFSLFKNKHKEDGDQRPDYRGDGMDLDGNLIEVAAWIKTPASGGKFMSCSIKRKDETKAQKPTPTKTPPYDPDDIPF